MTSFQEKPEGDGGWINGGFFVCSSAVLDLVQGDATVWEREPLERLAQKRLLRDRMADFGWLTPRILAHLDDTPDFYLDQVAQVVMDRWSSGRVGLRPSTAPISAARMSAMPSISSMASRRSR